MRDRLVELIKEVKFTPFKDGGGLDVSVKHQLPDHAFEAIADHLLAAGVIVPPCKVGDSAYHLTSTDTLEELNVAEIFEGKVCSVSKDEKTLWIYAHYNNGLNFWYAERDIGRWLFFTREEAEKALAERRENGLHDIC